MIGRETIVAFCILAFVLLCVTVIDARTKIIPNKLILFGTAVGIAWVVIGIFVDVDAPVWYDAILGSLAGAAPLFVADRFCLIVMKKNGFGFGDVKLMAMAGLFMGWRLAVVSLFVAFLAGGLYAAVLIFTKRAESGSYIAFGPFLSFGIISALFFGNTLMAFFLF